MLPQIDFTTYSSQFFWSTISFSFLYYTVSKIIVPKFKETLDNRAKDIDENIHNADISFKEISSLKTEYEANIKEAKNEAKLCREKNLDKFYSLQKEAKEQLNLELEAIMSKNLQKIDEDMRSFNKEQCPALISVASFVLAKILNTQPNAKILQECYNKLN